MDNNELENFLSKALPDVAFNVSGDGHHFDIAAEGTMFAGMSRLTQQKCLNKILQPLIKSGAVHAVNYKIKSGAVSKKEGK